MTTTRTRLALAVRTATLADASAQTRKAARAERRIAAVVADFDGELRAYERELKHFQRVPEFESLMGLRNALVAQSSRLKGLETTGPGSGPAVLAQALELDRTARELDAATGRLEKRAAAAPARDDRQVAGRMKAHADAMVRASAELVGMSPAAAPRRSTVRQ